MIRAGDLKWRIQIERPVVDESFDGAGSATWAFVDEAYAQVQDMLPSRGEKLANGVNIAARPARVRIRFREDITPDMRFKLGDRIMQIISGPAELGFREGLEFVCEDYSVAGNSA